MPGISLNDAEMQELKNCLLVCATETKTAADLQAYADALGGI